MDKMSERQLWSINALSNELNRNQRTVKRALQNVPPDGAIGQYPAWFLSSAVEALNPIERRFRPSSSGEEAAIHNVEAVWGDLRRGFTDLEREKDIDARRIMAHDTVAPLVHELEAALNAVWRSDQDRLVFGPLRDRVIATAIAELVKLCKLEMRDTDNGLALCVP
jgi:hypothetical protein